MVRIWLVGRLEQSDPTIDLFLNDLSQASIPHMLHEVGPLGIGDAAVDSEIAHIVPLPGSDGAINVRQDELAPHLDVGIASRRAAAHVQ